MKNKELKQKLKEKEAQDSYNVLLAYKEYRKQWSKSNLSGGGLCLKIHTLGNIDKPFEVCIDGESFDAILKSAIEQAIRTTLKRKQEYLRLSINWIEQELTKNN